MVEKVGLFLLVTLKNIAGVKDSWETYSVSLWVYQSFFFNFSDGNLLRRKKAFSTNWNFDIRIIKSDKFFLESLGEILDIWKKVLFSYEKVE